MMVDIWYPAEPSNAAPAEYMDAAAYEKAMGADGFQNFFREASETLRQGVKTHAFAAAPYARSAKRSPVLIFSPGGGMPREVLCGTIRGPRQSRLCCGRDLTPLWRHRNHLS